MAPAAADRGKLPLSLVNGCRDGLVIRDYPAGHSQSRLKQSARSDVRARHLIGKSISIRIDALTESFGRLNTMMMVEGIIAEFAKRYDSSGLMEWPDNETGG